MHGWMRDKDGNKVWCFGDATFEKVDGGILGRQSDREAHKNDILQPFDKQGRVNEQFAKRYGKKALQNASKTSGFKI